MLCNLKFLIFLLIEITEISPKVKGKKVLVRCDFNVPLDTIERGLIRGISGLLILFIVYGGFANLINEKKVSLVL